MLRSGQCPATGRPRPGTRRRKPATATSPRRPEQYVAAKWRQVVGSTMHCVAGDGIGILAAAVVTSAIGIPM
ncbi:DUF4396 domain-containing protein [Streptomyces sp. NPDC032940]|uniref:DUF4396 domain-containing protein n=1 Tax=Streptomyces sp. NPDC032940 TaxID=3155366 RepID=UPI0033CB579C